MKESEVRSIADKIVHKYKTMDDQKAQLKKRILTDKALCKSITERAISEFSDRHIFAARHRMTEQLHNTCVNSTHKEMLSTRPKNQKKSKRTPAVMAAVAGLLNTYPCGSKMIGNCTFREVLEQALRHQAMAHGNTIKYRILSRVSKLGKANEYVKDRMKDIDLERIISMETRKTSTG